MMYTVTLYNDLVHIDIPPIILHQSNDHFEITINPQELTHTKFQTVE